MARVSRPEFLRSQSIAARLIWCRPTVLVRAFPIRDSHCGERATALWYPTMIVARFSTALLTENISRSVGYRVRLMLLRSRSRDQRACALKMEPYYASTMMVIMDIRLCRSAAFSSGATSSRVRRYRRIEFVSGYASTHKAPRKYHA